VALEAEERLMSGETTVRTMLDAVAEADDLIMAVLLPVLARHELTVEHFRALRLLSEADGATVGEIAARTGTTPSSTTRLVDRLVERNLAYRRPAPTDRRSILLSLSDTGRTVWDSVLTDLG
jgi:DNA-binding MarR family transcriptional regulator